MDNRRSCDMRKHSDWLRLILGSQSGQIFYSAIFFTSNGHTWVQMYRQMYLKDVEIAKKVHIVGLNNKNIKQLIYVFVPIKSQIGREILKLLSNLSKIVMIRIVGIRRL